MKAKYILLLLAFLAFRMAYPQDSSGYKSVGNNWKITSQDIMFSISKVMTGLSITTQAGKRQ